MWYETVSRMTCTFSVITCVWGRRQSVCVVCVAVCVAVRQSVCVVCVAVCRQSVWDNVYVELHNECEMS